MSRVLLIRHCESTGPAPDAPLSDRGRAAAVALAASLDAHPIDHLVSSPHRRAGETAEPLALRRGLAVHVDERLAERRSSAEPLERWREEVRVVFSGPDRSLAGAETGCAALGRGLAALAAALASGHRLPVLVTHGQLMGLILHAADPRFGFAGWESLSNPDVYALDGAPGGPYTFARVALALPG